MISLLAGKVSAVLGDLFGGSLIPDALEFFDLVAFAFLLMEGLVPAAGNYDFLAFMASSLQIGHPLLRSLLLKELFDELTFEFLAFQLALGLLLVDHHLASSSVALLDCEIKHVLLFLNLIHGGSE